MLGSENGVTKVVEIELNDDELDALKAASKCC
jgi:malate/lactate dehydrogenase